MEITSYKNYESEQREDESEERETECIESRREYAFRLLNNLPENERSVVMHRYIGEMTETEISRWLGISVNTIQSRLQRAKQRLKLEDDHLIFETLRCLQLSTDLTDRVLERIATIKSIPPEVRPLFPLYAAASTLVLVLFILRLAYQQNFAIVFGTFPATL